MLNRDLSEPVIIPLADKEWEASPAAGVWRKKLEREEAESGKATSIVRYDPDSAFDTHTHPKGEEIYVIRGTFSDESGDYPAGSYLRNPRGSSHAPFSKDGCELFVKLCYFQPGDLQSVRIRTHQAGWHSGERKHIATLPLHQFHEESTYLVRLDPDTDWDADFMAGGREMLILEGALNDGKNYLDSLTWLRLPTDDKRRFRSGESGAKVLVKQGNLS